ncbi:hypothetical protein CC2G_012006 [Coprinopsis cinerea AmutBmut pab1-1]|nr:hypothetical protein CC2G_012006 [Coprinopsis cinerea AmutBmut pab1-1]
MELLSAFRLARRNVGLLGRLGEIQEGNSGNAGRRQYQGGGSAHWPIYNSSLVHASLCSTYGFKHPSLPPYLEPGATLRDDQAP